jgi:hypothetical protein
MAAQARRTMQRFLTQDAARERDLAFFAAFSRARRPPFRPTIQDLERYSPRWPVLALENPRLAPRGEAFRRQLAPEGS